MFCSLCQEDRELRRSHVIPEFMYQSMYDDIHRFHVLSTVPSTSNSMAQKGYRERLLCDSCEQIISRYERYVSHLMRGGIELEFEQSNGLLIVHGVDYTAFRLFQLSVLWRASISRGRFFANVSLGTHQEKLRSLLLTGDPGDPQRYGCLMFALLNEGNLQTDVMVQPTPHRVDSVRSYRFVFGGYVWVYLVANHGHPGQLETISLRPSGELRILLSPLSEAEFLRQFGLQLKEQGKL